MVCGFRVYGSGFKALGLGVQVQGLLVSVVLRWVTVRDEILPNYPQYDTTIHPNSPNSQLSTPNHKL